MHSVGALSSGVLQTLMGASPPLLALALGLHLLKVSAEARSWHVVLANAVGGRRVRFRTTWCVHVGSNGPNALLPGRLGEALRLAVARRTIPGSSGVTIGGTLVLAALLEVAFASVVVLVVVFGELALGARLPGVGKIEPLATLGIVAVCFLGAWFWLRARRQDGCRSSRLRQGFAVVGRPGALGAVLGWKVAACALRIGAVAAFLLAFHLSSSLWLALTVIAAQSISATVPFMPGNMGTQQAALTVALTGAAGATPARAVGFGVGMQAATIVADLASSVVALVFLIGLRGALSGALRVRRLVPGAGVAG